MDQQLTLSYASGDVSDLSIYNSELEIRSWNLFSVLLSIGHPVTPAELASRCRFVEASTEFVEFVCLVPDSPLSLSSDGLVTVSDCVCRGLQRFLVNSNRVFELLLPREIIRKRGAEDMSIMYSRKRRRLMRNDYGNRYKADQSNLSMTWRIPMDSDKVDIHIDDDALRNMIMNTENYSDGVYNEGKSMKSTVLSKAELECMNRFLNNRCICFPSSSTSVAGRLEDYFQFRSSSHLTASSHVRIEDIKDENCLPRKKPCTRSSKAVEHNRVISLVKDWIHNGSSRTNKNLLERQSLLEVKEYECIVDSACHEFDIEVLTNNTVSRSMIPDLNHRNINTLRCNDMTPCLSIGEKAHCQEVDEQNIVTPTYAENTDEAQLEDSQKGKKEICGREEQLVSLQNVEQDPENLLMSMDMTCKDNCSDAEPKLMTSSREHKSPAQKHLVKSTPKLETVLNDAKSTGQAVLKKTPNVNDVGSNIEQKHCRKDKRSVAMKQKVKPTYDQKMHTTGKRESIKENKEKAPTISVKSNAEPKVVPTFDSYVVEEEEGSGGYGTVYKARRKEDGKTFAVKYPHVNANRHHVYNEVKMLERFGGKNFVIKFEGSFKSNNSHCLVLEHVAHDRPEVLKREINVSQLQWYGYCLFSALASLHKQGVIHRDVKPGNFLFSRKANKGHLIDFNLATDLHQKFGSYENSKSHNDARFDLVPPAHPESKSRKYSSSKALETGTQTKFPKKLKKQIDQGADGSGITSTKDATSNRVPSGERFREPIPCTGRKQLLNLAHEAMQNRGFEVANTTPALKRKRVAATPAKLDNKFMYFTPMPLQCNGGLLKNKGVGKQQKEGPCAGTKGFRAPEVLLKSTFQGPKVDVWSAGVTLLYLIVGRTPFIGDPDQNIKEIAKLKGSEELWEVAKLHDRESSFPPELFQTQTLTSSTILEWCKQNTRRPDFLQVIPRSLIDLVEKCLMVNPRLRISAEDALRHDFFGPCLKELEKLRLKRQRDSRTIHSNSQPVPSEGFL